MLLPPFHLNTIGVFSPVPFTGFFFAGYRFPAGEFFPRFFCIAPQADLVQVSLVVHEYQSQNKGIRTAKGRGECMQLKNPGMDSSQGIDRASSMNERKNRKKDPANPAGDTCLIHIIDNFIGSP
jgi:hypothetical protein